MYTLNPDQNENYPIECMYPSLLFSAMGKIVEQTGFPSFVRATSPREGKTL